jgi:hypothetical protein
VIFFPIQRRYCIVPIALRIVPLELNVLPYGIFSTVTMGEYILDMKALTQEGVFAAIEFDHSTLEAATLNNR